MDRSYLDMSIRLVMLEKDLEHCRAEKAEAEVTVLNLARLNASNDLKAAEATSPEEVLALKRELTQRKAKQKMLKSRLGD